MKSFLGDTLPAQFVTVEHKPYKRKHVNRYGDDSHYYGVVKVKSLNATPMARIIASTIAVILSAAIWVLFSMWISIPATLLIGFFVGRKIVAGNLGKEQIDTEQLGRNFVDEVQGCIEVFERLVVAATLTPEGSGIRARTDQYGIMIMMIMNKLALLKEANEIVGGKSGNFYASTTEIKNQLENLKQTGYSLVEMTAQKRIDSVMEDMQYVGIEEFTSQVGEEVMIYRAIGRGDS